MELEYVLPSAQGPVQWRQGQIGSAGNQRIDREYLEKCDLWVMILQNRQISL